MWQWAWSVFTCLLDPAAEWIEVAEVLLVGLVNSVRSFVNHTLYVRENCYVAIDFWMFRYKRLGQVWRNWRRAENFRGTRPIVLPMHERKQQQVRSSCHNRLPTVRTVWGSRRVQVRHVSSNFSLALCCSSPVATRAKEKVELLVASPSRPTPLLLPSTIKPPIQANILM